MQDRPDSTDAYEAIFDALAQPARRRILISLNFAGGTMSAGEIARLFGHAWPTTTRHLQVMMAAGLVSPERKGRVRRHQPPPGGGGGDGAAGGACRADDDAALAGDDGGGAGLAGAQRAGARLSARGGAAGAWGGAGPAGSGG